MVKVINKATGLVIVMTVEGAKALSHRNDEFEFEPVEAEPVEAELVEAAKPKRGAKNG
jgi:hypothetical protein